MAVKKRKESESQLNVDVPKDLMLSLDLFCEAAKMKRKSLVELAIRRFINDRMQPDARV